MSPHVQQQLMRYVESIVGPITATHDLKMKMRLELFDHAEQIFAEEFKQTPDEKKALEATFLRLGSQSELREELQSSVSRFVHFGKWLDSNFSWRPGESLLRQAARVFTFAFSSMMLFHLISLTVITIIRDTSAFSQIGPFLTFQSFLFGVAASATSIIASRFFDDKYHTPQTSLTHLVFGTLSISIITTACMTSLMAWGNQEFAYLWPTALASFLSSSVLVAIVATLRLKERKQARSWEQSLLISS